MLAPDISDKFRRLGFQQEGSIHQEIYLFPSAAINKNTDTEKLNA